jgi:hypothetical protein
VTHAPTNSLPSTASSVVGDLLERRVQHGGRVRGERVDRERCPRAGRAQGVGDRVQQALSPANRRAIEATSGCSA